MKYLGSIQDNKDLVTKEYADNKYTKPSGGIPKTDLTSAVQTSLDKADTAYDHSQTAHFSGSYNDLTNKPPIASGTGTNSLIFNDSDNIASGNKSMAVGSGTTASGLFSYAEGADTIASSDCAHAEGRQTTASEECAHAEGYESVASGAFAHAEGEDTEANGVASHAEGSYTQASSDFQHVQGRYNVIDSASAYADIVGWGDDTSRKNISALTTTGNLRLKGDVYISCNDDSTGGTSIQTALSNKANIAIYSTDSVDTNYATPTQVKAALDAGTNVVLTHTDNMYGEIKFTHFIYSALANNISTNMMASYGANIVNYVLIGTLSGNSWIASVTFVEDSANKVTGISDESTDAEYPSAKCVYDSLPTDLSDLTDDSTHRLVTDTEKSTWNGKQNAITSSNKLSYSLISGTPTIPTSLSNLTDNLGTNPTHAHYILKSAQYGSTLPTSGTEGQLFFLIE